MTRPVAVQLWAYGEPSAVWLISLQEVGYRGEIGYQTFLYSNEADIRKLFMFLVENLPKESSESASEPAMGKFNRLSANHTFSRRCFSRTFNSLMIKEHLIWSVKIMFIGGEHVDLMQHKATLVTLEEVTSSTKTVSRCLESRRTCEQNFEKCIWWRPQWKRKQTNNTQLRDWRGMP